MRTGRIDLSHYISHIGVRESALRVRAGQPDTSTCLVGVSISDGAKERDVEGNGSGEDIPDTGKQSQATIHVP